LEKTKVIAAYAGTGKTTAAKLYPDAVIDFVCMPYKYVLDDDTGPIGEEDKANHGYDMQYDWPRNYVEAIKEAISGEKYLLIPTDLYVLALLRQENIPYWLVFPQRSSKEAYRKRFLDRGNTDIFIDIFIGGWDNFIFAFEQDDYGRHIVLEPHQFLSDTHIFC
jgi:hypothetical protein